MVDNGSLQQRPIWEGPRPKGRHSIRLSVHLMRLFLRRQLRHKDEKGIARGKIGGTFVLSQSDYVICGLPNDELIVMSADARYLSPEGMGTKSEGQAHSLRLQLDHRI